jgi:hypothetical protein
MIFEGASEERPLPFHAHPQDEVLELPVDWELMRNERLRKPSN